MSRSHIAVVGGGLAGMAAALACGDAGAEVTLCEARPRLGGATFSTELQGLAVDNGQHVFLRCCTEYLGFLERVGAREKTAIQPRLAIPVLTPNGVTSWLRRAALPAPLHLAPSLLRYGPLTLAERLRLVPAARKLAALDLGDPALDRATFGEWLARNAQSARAIERFWDLVTRPTVNLPAAEASLLLAAKVFQTGLLQAPEAADVGYAAVPLAQVHGDPAERALEKLGASVWKRARVQRIELGPDGAAAVWVAGQRLACDAVVLAAPHEDAAKLVPDAAGVDAAELGKLGSSPILNLHAVWDRRVLPHPFAAGVGTPLEWIFDRTGASGLDRGQYLAVSLSAADRWLGRSAESLRETFEPAFRALLPAARDAELLRFFTTCEPTATFRGAPGTRALRPRAETRVRGLYLAGAWTDTGWPATMEGAVRSGRAAARAALCGLGQTEQLPEIAA
ncbi:MAG TPA: hydroxysqualene dehydroxylase HpnE [Myxococcota bacterium]|nr:hydroxysqualene dehydroxylase HpnE [Myxococcota bacterium]